MIVLVATMVGILGVFGSLAFNGWQMHQLTKQTKLQNAIAGTSGAQQALQMLHGVLRMLFEQPELRSYFYDGRECLPSSTDRSRVLTVAEMLGDALEIGLQTTSSIKSTFAFDDWLDYTRFIIEHSPALRETVAAHPAWYSELHKYRKELSTGAAPHQPRLPAVPAPPRTPVPEQQNEDRV
jgi:hypothetical protein